MKRFSDTYPPVAIIYYVFVLVFSLSAKHPVYLAISAVCSLACDISYKGIDVLKTFVKICLPAVVVITFLNGFTSHWGETVLFKIKGGNNICLEPFIYGFVTGIDVSAVILIFDSFNFIFTSDKLIFVLGSKAKNTGAAVTMALREIPLIGRRFRETREALAGIGEYGSDGRKKNFMLSASILASMISRTVEESVIRSDSMISRGWGLKKSSRYGKFIFSFSDRIILCFSVVLALITAAGLLSGYGEVIYNPYFEMRKTDAVSLIFFICYFLLLTVPLIFNLSEVVKYKKFDKISNCQ